MTTLDRYVIRQIVPPFLLALGVFTFVLAIMPMLDYARMLLSKGVPLPTVGLLLVLLLPQALSLTIPMSFLTGLLMAMGRISGDRESVALLACGVSPIRLLRPVLLLGLVVGGLDLYVLIRATPDSNQAFVSIRNDLLTTRTATEIRPRVFYDGFPGKVLYVRDSLPDGRWSGIFLATTADQTRPFVTLAETGSLQINREEGIARLHLGMARQYTPSQGDDRVYVTVTQDPVIVTVSAEEIFGSGRLDSFRGTRELSYTGLQNRIRERLAKGEPPHQEIMQLQQMFAFPVACVVFAIVGLALGLNTRSEGRLAGLTLGLGVILLYYGVFAIAESWTKGVAEARDPVESIATWARWWPNIVLGAVGLIALWRQTRPNGLNLPWLPAFLTTKRVRSRASRQAKPGDPAVLVVRLPRFGFPVPRILDRYVSGLYVKTALLSLASLLALFYVVTLVDQADQWFKGNAPAAVFLKFLLFSTPEFITFVVPMATLVAGLATIGALTRTGELTVMRACGISLYRAAAPLLVFAVVWSGLLFVLEDRVLSEANRTASEMRQTIRGAKPTALRVANHQWLVGDGDRIMHYAFLEPAGPANANRPTLHRLSVFETASSPYRLTSHSYADRARFEAATWQAEDGWRQSIDLAAVTREDFTRQPIALAPIDDFKRAQVDARAMSFREMRAYLQRLGASGYNVTEQLVDLHRKLAFPAVAVVMTLLAIPFGVTIGRRGALYGIGLAMVIAVGYLLLMSFFMAVGAAGLLPPVLAAWGANVIFGASALGLLFTVRT